MGHHHNRGTGHCILRNKTLHEKKKYEARRLTPASSIFPPVGKHRPHTHACLLTRDNGAGEKDKTTKQNDKNSKTGTQNDKAEKQKAIKQEFKSHKAKTQNSKACTLTRHLPTVNVHALTFHTQAFAQSYSSANWRMRCSSDSLQISNTPSFSATTQSSRPCITTFFC